MYFVLFKPNLYQENNITTIMGKIYQYMYVQIQPHNWGHATFWCDRRQFPFDDQHSWKIRSKCPLLLNCQSSNYEHVHLEYVLPTSEKNENSDYLLTYSFFVKRFYDQLNSFFLNYIVESWAFQEFLKNSSDPMFCHQK